MPIYITNKLTIDTEQRTILADGEALVLPPLSFDLLVLLISKAPTIVSLDTIVETVWQRNISDETVTQRIALIRKALKEHQLNHQCIESVRSQGYRWLPRVQTVEDIKQFQPPTQSKGSYIKWGLLSVVIIVLVVVIKSFLPTDPLEPLEVQTPTKVSEYNKQGNFYLKKFDAPSNGIAIALFKQSLSLDPHNLDALLGLSSAYSHQVTKFNGQEELLIQSIQYAKLATELAPKDPQAWSGLAFAYDAMGNIDKAILYYQKSLTLRPDHQATQGSLAYLLMVKGQLAESLARNIKAFDGAQHYRYLQIAQTLYLLGSHDAEKWFAQSLELSPDSVFAASTFAQALFAQGRLDQAKAVAHQAIAHNIQQADLYKVLGLIALKQQNYIEAIQQFHQAKAIADDYHINAFLLLAKHMNGERDDRLLQQQLNHMEQHNSEISWPNIYIHFAVVQIVEQKPEQAALNILKAVQLGYSDRLFLQQLGSIVSIESAAKFIEALQLVDQRIAQQNKLIEQQQLFEHSVLTDTL